MPEYTLLATCDRCKKQVVSNPKTDAAIVSSASGLMYNEYVHQKDGTTAYLCPECHKLAQNMRDRHYKERQDFFDV